MYMGFMKMGLSFTLGFMILLMIVGITNIGAFAVLPITLYIYSFFHANNLGGLDDESFMAVEDEYLFGLGSLKNQPVKIDQKVRKAAAVVLIVVGIYMLWNVLFELLRSFFGWDNPVSAIELHGLVKPGAGLCPPPVFCLRAAVVFGRLPSA